MTFEQFVAPFQNARPCNGGVTVRCPAHDDRQASLKATRGNDRILIHCHAGCTPEQICAARGCELIDLFYAPRSNGNSNGNGAGSHGQAGLTLAEFAAAKGFERRFLTDNGVSEEKGSLVFHYLLMNGQRAARQRIRLSLTGDKRFIWNKADGRPGPYGLWKLEAWRKAGIGDLILCEGESDALTLWCHQMAAIGIPGADNTSLLQAAHVQAFSRVLIAKENDAGGEVFEKGCVGRLAALEYSGRVAVVELSRMGVKDSNELHLKCLKDPGSFKAAWACLVDDARPVELPIVGLETLDASAITAERVEWLWKDRIPLGKLSLLVGPPGLGKSFASLDLIARASNGRAWPDGAPGITARSLIFSAEDSPADTIVPRLQALGAERGMIHIAKRVREANEAGQITRRAFSLTRDLPHVERLLDKHPDIRILVVGPVSAYLGRVDSHKNAEIRNEVLDPLSELAERRKIAVIAVSHFVKGGGSNALEKVSGSIAFPAAARAVWGFARDPDDPSRRLMLFAKSNCGPEMQGLAFRILPDDQGQIILQWIDGPVSQKLDDVLRREAEDTRGGNDDSKLAAAAELIQRLCRDGAYPSALLEEEGGKLGIAAITLRRARKLLGCASIHEGYGKNVRWMVKLR